MAIPGGLPRASRPSVGQRLPLRACGRRVGAIADRDGELWLKPDSDGGPEPDRAEFPSPPEPPARILTAPAKRTPSGWRKVLSRGRQPERVTFRSETSTRSMPFHIRADKVRARQSSPGRGALPRHNPCPADARGRRAAHRPMERRHASSQSSEPFRRLSSRRLESASRHRRGSDGEPRSIRGLDMARPRGATRHRSHHGHQTSGRRASLPGHSLPEWTRSTFLACLGRHTAVPGVSPFSHTSRIPAAPISSRSPRTGSTLGTSKRSWTRFPPSATPRFSWQPIPRP